VIALVVQFSRARCVAWAYWFAVAIVGVFGTTAADMLHLRSACRTRPPRSCTGCNCRHLLHLVAHRGHTAHSSIDTPRPEGFYWAAVVATFAMGGVEFETPKRRSPESAKHPLIAIAWWAGVQIRGHECTADGLHSRGYFWVGS
jgi:hypothetical protein